MSASNADSRLEITTKDVKHDKARFAAVDENRLLRRVDWHVVPWLGVRSGLLITKEALA
jgi:hypothetical protein